MVEILKTIISFLKSKFTIVRNHPQECYYDDISKKIALGILTVQNLKPLCICKQKESCDDVLKNLELGILSAKRLKLNLY